MIVGILKEIKTEENRVCMTPAGVEIMKMNGHDMLVEKNAGAGSGFADEAYVTAGAKMIDTPKEIFDTADMVMHVKEPLPPEYDLIREGQIVFTYLHLAADETQTRALIKSQLGEHRLRDDPEGRRQPAPADPHERSGRAHGHPARRQVPGDGPGRPRGPAGRRARRGSGHGGGDRRRRGRASTRPRWPAGLGAKVYLLDMNLDRLRYLSDVMPANCFTLMSSPATIRKLVKEADVVVGAVLIPGAKAPKLVTREMLKTMKKGAVLVDVAIDQGGCFETSKATTHGDPIYVVDGVIHYCVANMPGAVAKTSTLALTNATLPYAVEIANKGWKKAMQENEEIRLGANVIDGKVTYQAVAEAFELEYFAIEGLL